MRSRDEIVDDVRSVREAYAAKFDYDLTAMCRDMKAKEQVLKARIAILEPSEPVSHIADLR